MSVEALEHLRAQFNALECEAQAEHERIFGALGVEDVGAEHCNQYGHHCNKGTTREPKDKAPDNRFVIDSSLRVHEKVAKLADLLEQARRDGARLEVEIPGAAWGDTLILPSGREDPDQKAGAHGVKHALEKRHEISAKKLATALLYGDVEPSEKYPSRMYVKHGKFQVVLEREIHIGSGRISRTKAKLHTLTYGHE